MTEIHISLTDALVLGIAWGVTAGTVEFFLSKLFKRKP